MSRSFVWIPALLLAGSALAAEPVKVTLQLNWLPEPEFGGIYAAQRTGAFARNGLDVTILKGGPDVPAVQMAAAGRVQFAVAAADEVVSLREKGADVVAIFATYQTNPQAIMVKADNPVASIPALLKTKGTLIAQPGLAYLKYLQQRYGLGRLKLLPYGSGAMAQFLDPGNRDVAMQCFLFAEPLTARREGVPAKVFLIADTGFDPYAGVIVTNARYLKAHPDVAGHLVAALREGWRDYLGDPAPTNLVMADLNPSMDLGTFAAAAAAQRPLLESEITRAHGLGAMSSDRWSRLIDQLQQLDVIGQLIPASSCFVNLDLPAGAAPAPPPSR